MASRLAAFRRGPSSIGGTVEGAVGIRTAARMISARLSRSARQTATMTATPVRTPGRPTLSAMSITDEVTTEVAVPSEFTPVQGSRVSGTAEILKGPPGPLDLPLDPAVDLIADTRPQGR